MPEQPSEEWAPPAQPAIHDRTAGIVAVVLGGSGLVVPLVVPSIIGLVMGIRVRRRAKAEGDQANHSLGTVAIALSCVALALVVLMVAVIVMLSVAFQCPPPTGNETVDAEACPPL